MVNVIKILSKTGSAGLSQGFDKISNKGKLVLLDKYVLSLKKYQKK